MKLLMTAKDGKERAGVMIPIPQYPLYTATIAEYNAFPVSNQIFLFTYFKCIVYYTCHLNPVHL